MICNGHALVAKPPAVSFTEAATIPTVFLTAYSCLHDEAAVSTDSRVLVHAATGDTPLYNMPLCQKTYHVICTQERRLTGDQCQLRLPGPAFPKRTCQVRLAWAARTPFHLLKSFRKTFAGGLGLAAIQIATAAGARVLATAGSVQKRTYLRQHRVASVVSSRSLDYGEHLGCREGAQPTIVLNSLTSPGL